MVGGEGDKFPNHASPQVQTPTPCGGGQLVVDGVGTTLTSFRIWLISKNLGFDENMLV